MVLDTLLHFRCRYNVKPLELTIELAKEIMGAIINAIADHTTRNYMIKFLNAIKTSLKPVANIEEGHISR